MKKQLSQTEAENLERCTLMFASIVSALDSESTRFIGKYKHDKKKQFNRLCEVFNSFIKTIDNNVDPENIDTLNSLHDYLNDLNFSLIDTYGEEAVFNSLCKVLKYIYTKYIYSDYKHKHKEEFINVYTIAYNYASQYENVILDYNTQNFCTTLIEGGEFTLNK